MKDQEQLENIKNNSTFEHLRQVFFVGIDDMNFLVKQAERVQELESAERDFWEMNELQKKANRDFWKIKEENKRYSERVDVYLTDLEKMATEINRYREAFRNILHSDDCSMGDVMKRMHAMQDEAEKALAGDPE